MIYLTYEEYKNIGGICDETAFNRYIVRACNIVDNATHNRISKDLLKDVAVAEFQAKWGKNTVEIPIDEITSSVEVRIKHLCRDLTEYLAGNPEIQNQLTSESHSEGAVSQSFGYATKKHDESNAEIDKMIYDYLANITTSTGVSLLYMGCSE